MTKLTLSGLGLGLAAYGLYKLHSFHRKETCNYQIGSYTESSYPYLDDTDIVWKKTYHNQPLADAISHLTELNLRCNSFFKYYIRNLKIYDGQNITQIDSGMTVDNALSLLKKDESSQYVSKVLEKYADLKETPQTTSESLARIFSR